MTKRSGAVKQQPFGVFIQRVGAERGEKHLDFAEPTIAGSLEGMVSFLSIETGYHPQRVRNFFMRSSVRCWK